MHVPCGGRRWRKPPTISVSVAAATLLFEAVRQRQAAGLIPSEGEGLSPELFDQTLFEWAYPQVARWCRDPRTGPPTTAIVKGKVTRQGKSVIDIKGSVVRGDMKVKKFDGPVHAVITTFDVFARNLDALRFRPGRAYAACEVEAGSAAPRAARRQAVASSHTTSGVACRSETSRCGFWGECRC